MAKLTQRQTILLERVLYHLERADHYVQKPTIAVAIKDSHAATTALHYTRNDGATLYEVDKQIGSDLTGLADGIRLLRDFLVPAKVAEP